MKASQNLPGVLPDAICRDDGPAPGEAAAQPNLVIVNLAELAATGTPRFTVCIASSALTVPGHQG
jgi:hypothetical protein